MIQLLSKYKSYIFSFLLMVVMIFAVNIFAAEPTRTLGFQGQFYTYNTPGNNPVSATFTFYDSPTGGNVTGTPISKIIQVVNGYFGTTFTEADTTGVDLNQQLYLEVSINGTTLTPRTTVNPTVSSLKSFGTFSYASAPAVGPAGSLYFNTTDNVLYTSNGTTWTRTSSSWLTNGTSTYYTAGNVGVGTNNPGALLEVNKDLGTSTGQRELVKIINGGLAGIGLGYRADGISAIGGYIRSTGALPLFIETSGSPQALTLLNSGHFGVGSTTPSARLSVTGFGSTIQTTFRTANSSNIPTFTILDNGNVGVGTSSPVSKFSVAGVSYFSSASTPQITINREGTSNASINFTNSTGSVYVGSAQNGSFVVSNDVNLATATPYLYIAGVNAPGRVGLNTSDPRFRLSVNGTSGNGYFGITNSAFGDIFMINGSGFVGIGTTTPSQILVASGTIQSTALLGGATTLSTDANGNIIRTPSDQKLKTNVETLTSALDKVNQMRGVSYNWIDTARFGTSTEIGFIAQELETIVPEVVKSGGEYKSVNYQNLTALLTEAIKELSAKVTGFGEKFTSKEIETDKLCVKKSDGTRICVTGDQLEAALIGGNSHDSGSVSVPADVPVDEPVVDLEPVPEVESPAEPVVVEAPVVEE